MSEQISSRIKKQRCIENISYGIDSKELKETSRIDDVTFRKWKAMTEVNSEEEIMRVYPIVMEAMQKFDLKLE